MKETQVPAESTDSLDLLASAVRQAQKVVKGQRERPHRKDILETKVITDEMVGQVRQVLLDEMVCPVPLGAEVFQEKVPEENPETKVTQVSVVVPVNPGYVELMVKSLGASRASVVYLVTTATQAMMEFQEHLAAQVLVMLYQDLLGCLDLQDPLDCQVSQVLRA